MSTGDGSGRTIPAVTAAAADRFGGQVAVEDGSIRLTYAELFDEARTFAAALAASGVEPGDRVAIWAFNSAEWVVAALGLWQAGAVLVPVNTRFKGGEAADLLARSRARALVTVTDFLGTDYVDMLRSDRHRAPRPRDDHRGPRARAVRHRVVGRVRRAGHRHPPRRSSNGGAPEWARTIRPTSCSPRGRRAGPRAW